MSIISTMADRDIHDIDFGDWPTREMHDVQGVRESRFQVVMRQSVRDEIHRHGQETPSVEVCGVLVGHYFRDVRGPYLLIENCIRGNEAKMKATAVTFTTDTWQHIHQTMDRQYSTRKIVGWYHTHPGFGIFLSEMDVFICQHFFNLPWQTAFVFDPHSLDEGNFIWRGGRPEKDPMLIEMDAQPEPDPTALAAIEMEKKFIELRIRIRRLERRQTLLAMALAFATAFTVMWKLGYLSDGFNQLTNQLTPQPTTQPTTTHSP